MESTEKYIAIWETDDKEDIAEYAYKCTRKEAEQFPLFEWLALEELLHLNK